LNVGGVVVDELLIVAIFGTKETRVLR